MRSEIDLGTRIIVSGALLLGQTGCFGSVSTEEIHSTTTPRNTLTVEPPIPLPSKTPTRTPRPTSTFTPTLTPSPTLDWGVINTKSIETALDEETITLRQFAFDRIIVLHPFGIKDLIYGAETDDKGQTTVLFENLDCQFVEIRNLGLLGDKEDIGTQMILADSWKADGVIFDEVRVKKTSELPGDIEVFQSESFVLDGEEVVCPKVPVIKPATEFTKRVYDQAKNIVVELVNKYSDAKLTPIPVP